MSWEDTRDIDNRNTNDSPEDKGGLRKGRSEEESKDTEYSNNTQSERKNTNESTKSSLQEEIKETEDNESKPEESTTSFSRDKIVANTMEIWSKEEDDRNKRTDKAGEILKFNRAMDIATDYFSKFYIRINIRDQVGVIKSVGEIAEKYDVGIHAVLQTPIENPDDIDFVVTTETTRLEQVQAMVADIAKQQFCLKDPVFFGCL